MTTTDTLYTDFCAERANFSDNSYIEREIESAELKAFLLYLYGRYVVSIQNFAA